MSKNLFTRTERTTEPDDAHRIAIGTGLVNALNITWANLKTWLGTYFASLSGATFTGDITASNLSGTNTGNQDLSPFVRNDIDNQELFNDFRFEGFVKFDELINVSLPIYTDNAAAILAGRVVGDFYRTASGEIRIVIQ